MLQNLDYMILLDADISFVWFVNFGISLLGAYLKI
jgi:hypothetical protein